MKTEIISSVNNFNLLENAANAVREGKVVAFPTETVYGLGCSMHSEEGIKEIYRIKGRDFSNPLSAHISDISQVEEIALEIDERLDLLMKNFWPGPLAIIVKKKSGISNMMTSGMNTIGIRYPDDETAIKLIEAVGHPIAGTSANLSGGNSAVEASQVIDTFDGKIPYIIDGGKSKYSKESTIISLAEKDSKLLRIGALDPNLIIEKTGISLIK
jgi:L-threonylcarbamoyladenylate synthase